jgi:integrase
VGNEIQRVRSVFKYGYDAALIDRPIRFGPGFKKPSAKVLRQNRAKGGLRMFEREELLVSLEHATTNAKAMMLLGINAGMGNTDLAMLPTKAIKLKTGWLDHPRPKTGIPRHVPLWPETVEAIRAALAERHAPKDTAHAPLLFIGPRGESYIGKARGYRVHQEVARVLKWAKVERQGLSFYALRHTFQTMAEGAHDLAAVQSIMGHAAASGDMSAVYRERVDDARLLAAVEHVRKWLFGEQKTKQDRALPGLWGSSPRRPATAAESSPPR